MISSFDVPDDSLIVDADVDSLQALYALVSNADDRIDANSLCLNISSGNIIIIIDGLDEIQAKLKEKFNIDDFIGSVINLNDTYQNCSVIITSREIDKRSFPLSDVSIYSINGFDEKLIGDYLNKRFKGGDAQRKKDKALELITGLGESSQVMPLILRFACELTDESYQRSVTGESQYLKLTEPLDKIVYQLMSREIGKQNLGIKNCDQYFEILADIIFQFNGSVNENDLFDLVSLSLAGTGNEATFEISKNYHNSSLLRKDNYFFRIKFDAIEFLIKSRFLSYSFNNKSKENDINVINTFAKNCYRGGPLSRDIAKHRNQSGEYEKFLINNGDYNPGLIKNEMIFRKLISSILYLNFDLCNLDRDARTEKLISLFHLNNGEVKGLSIFGDFYSLNFDLLSVKNGYFDGYSQLSKSFIPKSKVIFKSCYFYNLNGRDFGKTLGRENFDSECVICEELQDVIERTDGNKDRVRENAITDLKKILGVGYNGGAFSWKSEQVHKQQCATLKINNGIIPSLAYLSETNIVLKESSKYSPDIGYRVNNIYSLEVKEFLTQTIISEKIEEALQKYLRL